jgi:hypothetical protein
MVISFRGAAAPLPGLAEVRAYWEALRTADRVPHRGQIDPRGMAGTLDRVLLIEEIAPGMARLRLAGQAVCDLLGMEVRGMPLAALFDPMARRPLESEVARVFSGRIVTLDVAAEGGIGRPALAGKLLLLPVEGFEGRTDLALGCLSLAGQVGRAPRRLILSRAASEVAAPLQAVAEDAAPFVPAPARGHLRLVKSDRDS